MIMRRFITACTMRGCGLRRGPSGRRAASYSCSSAVAVSSSVVDPLLPPPPSPPPPYLVGPHVPLRAVVAKRAGASPAARPFAASVPSSAAASASASRGEGLRAWTESIRVTRRAAAAAAPGDAVPMTVGGHDAAYWHIVTSEQLAWAMRSLALSPGPVAMDCEGAALSRSGQLAMLQVRPGGGAHAPARVCWEPSARASPVCVSACTAGAVARSLPWPPVLWPPALIMRAVGCGRPPPLPPHRRHAAVPLLYQLP